MKYDFNLDIYSDNANADIISRINDGSVVLEVGAANGRMTKYLSIQKKCMVDIVEIDPEAGKEAAKYAKDACLGVNEGDIAGDAWEHKFGGKKYDVIIFADVLEHLLNPEDVLKKCSLYLKKEGKILCSIPNIAHASVIISLLNDDFSYTTTGLLDETHVHFFTRTNFCKMVKTCGYHVVYEHAIKQEVGTNEIPYSYYSIDEEVSLSLKKRDNNEAYQYIFELKKNANTENIIIESDMLPGVIGELKCYLKRRNETGYNTNVCVTKQIQEEIVDVEIDLSHFDNIAAVDLKLLDVLCMVKINAIYCNGILVESYDTNGTRLAQDIICGFEEPVNISFWIPDDMSKPCLLHIKYEILAYGNTLIHKSSIFRTIYKELEDGADKGKRALEREQNKNSQMFDKINALENKNSQMFDKINALENKNTELKNSLENLRNENVDLKKQNGELVEKLVITERDTEEAHINYKNSQSEVEALHCSNNELSMKLQDEQQLLKQLQVHLEDVDSDRIRLYHIIEDLNGIIAHKEKTISWRITKPLRIIGGLCIRIKERVFDCRKLIANAIEYKRYNGMKATIHRAFHYKQVCAEKEKKKQEIIEECAQEDLWMVLEKWIDNTPHEFIDIFPVPMGWNTPLFQRFQHLSLQAGNVGGISIYGAHPAVDKEVSTYSFVSETLCIVNLEDSEVVDRLWKILDKKTGLKYLRIQSIDLATTIEKIEDYMRRGYKIVYEYIDEITPQITGNIPGFVLKRHEYLLRNEEIIVVATSDKLISQVEPYRKNNMIMLNNGVDYEHWNIKKEEIICPEDIKHIVEQNKIIVGYHGALAQWIDYELLQLIAEDDRVNLLLIGYEHDDNLKKSGILKMSNVYYIGAKNYQELNQYCAFYDVAILPFIVNDITLSVSPVKIFEYMASGKPVVSYDLPECLKYESCLCAHTQDEFIQKLDRAIELINDKNYLELLRKDAMSNTWTSIMKKMVDFIVRSFPKYEEVEFELNYTGDERNEYLKQVLAIPTYVEKQYYKEIADKPYVRNEKDCKIIAYYLTQFHPDKHNEDWWGKGVTEWNNVCRAVPQYKDHYQPRIPGELGYYDLRLIDNMSRQIELAKMYGIYGFSFYYYWFDGERLLEQPLEMFLSNKSLDFPFSLCWANENWTRKFDGTNEDILMKQPDSYESYCNVIADISRFLIDERYIDICGRKILTVYRPSLMPQVKKVLSNWRNYCRDNSVGELYIIAVKENGINTDWLELGYDAITEFHPGTLYTNCVNITENLKFMRNDFQGEVFSYPDIVYKQKYFNYDTKKLYRAVMPMWDNTARRNNKGMIFQGATPDLYKRWLRDVISESLNRKDLDDNIIFINAWNEWGEGAYLEPDKRYGYAYLQATKEALEEERTVTDKHSNPSQQ